MDIRNLVEMKIIPTMLFENSENFMSNILNEKEAYITRIYDDACKTQGLENPYTDSDFCVTICNPNQNHTVYSIRMPQSDLRISCCRSVIITVEESEENTVFCYFTVEYLNEPLSVLGEVKSDGSYAMHGKIPEDDAQIKVFELAFGWKNYTESYKRDELRKTVVQSAENWEVREFTEQIYIPVMLLMDPDLFIDYLQEQGGYFLCCIYNRVAKLMQRDILFRTQEFSATEYVSEEDHMDIWDIRLPKENMQNQNFWQMCIIGNYKTGEIKLSAAGKNENREECIYQFNADIAKYEITDDAPNDPQKLLEKMIQIALFPNAVQYEQYIPAKCPLCKRTFRLGLTAEELEGYRQFAEEGEDIQDVLPKLNLFEREFLMSGLCPECQANTFNKDLPDDLSRWECD
ncbi:MAG: hypothetical protein ACI396_05490 [Acutalibacteraceae bacterium]